MDEVYYESTSRGRIPVSDMCDEHVRRAFKKLLREREDSGPHCVYVRVNGGMVKYERTE